MWTIRGNLSHACAMAAQRNQSGDDSCFTETNVPNNDHASVYTGIGTLQLRIDLVEHPVSANEHRLCRDTGHLKEQRLQRDVRRSIRCKAYCKEGTQGKNRELRDEWE